MTIVEHIDARGTQHCETTTLGVLLRHQGVDFSEPMLFGLGSGLSFIYWDSKTLPFPFLGGRVKPFELTKNLAGVLGLDLLVAETTSPRRAWQNVAALLDAGRPVGLQLDSYHLDYFSTKVHFGGHMVAMYGYDDERAYLVDTAPQGGAVTTGLAGLARARAERGPMTARHRSFTVTVPAAPAAPKDRIVPAIRTCAHSFLNPPIANLGHRGIEKAAQQVPRWLRRSGNPGEDLPRAAALMEKAGTGGALFRNLYRDFLDECTQLIDHSHLRTGHRLYTEAAALWTRVAALIAAAGESGDPENLVEAGSALRELSRVETAAMQALGKL
ncbi:BtrH N-terminal domain-containing protein [Streptomyces lavendulocolor]|uniref:BtrH N-terminal domain-containing protein n=1 Tax=Streptomyces lavendulocolor TaxID=67316 RepID=UPI003C2EEA03